MINFIENKHLKKLLAYLNKRITKGEGIVAHWIWDQPKSWEDKRSCRALFLKKEYSANLLVFKYFNNGDDPGLVPRTPARFTVKPMSHVLIPTCGNKRCVRPSHQKWVNIIEYKEITACRGDSHGKILMTEKKRIRLYEMLDSGEYDRTEKTKIAEMFGVKVDTIYSYKRKWNLLQKKE